MLSSPHSTGLVSKFDKVFSFPYIAFSTTMATLAFVHSMAEDKTFSLTDPSGSGESVPASVSFCVSTAFKM